MPPSTRCQTTVAGCHPRSARRVLVAETPPNVREILTNASYVAHTTVTKPYHKLKVRGKACRSTDEAHNEGRKGWGASAPRFHHVQAYHPSLKCRHAFRRYGPGITSAPTVLHAVPYIPITPVRLFPSPTTKPSFSDAPTTTNEQIRVK